MSRNPPIMPWYIYSLARGSAFYAGVGVLLLAVLLRLNAAARWRRLIALILTVLAISLICISAAALPLWLCGTWATVTLGWMVAPLFKRRSATVGTLCMMLGITTLVAGTELTYYVRPSAIRGVFPRLYVIGDSISSGIGAERGHTWPVLLATEHHVDVVDLSRAGATIDVARRQLETEGRSSGLVVLEIGGNDMLGRAGAARFAADLESLVSVCEGDGRKVIMLELPLFPFDDAYGVAQRRICRKHGIMLIPRRFFVDVLQCPGATVDGIHLSVRGQQRLEEMIWSFVGVNLQRR